MNEKDWLRRLGQRAMEKTGFDQSFEDMWQKLCAPFADVLEPAFQDQPLQRIEVASILNLINLNQVKDALTRLDALNEECTAPPERILWLFIRGLAMERCSQTESAIECYAALNAFSHRFFYPYRALARYAHGKGRYQEAEHWFRKCISCLEQSICSQRTELQAGVMDNLASSLVMMHRYDEADALLEESLQLQPQLKMRYASVKAFTAAIRGDTHLVWELMGPLREKEPATALAMHQTIQAILSGNYPHVTVAPPPAEDLPGFWIWFQLNTQSLARGLHSSKPEKSLTLLSDWLTRLFSYCRQKIVVRHEVDGTRIRLFWIDGYNLSAQAGLQALLSQCPEELQDQWEFVIIHEEEKPLP